jgi:hypothetical protein
MTFADKVLTFNKSLRITAKLPEGVKVLNPFENPDTFTWCSLFYRKFYSDTSPRTIILGINPGRFGAGLTGIPFTDPVKLEEQCGIKNSMPKKAELSADYIYQLIDAFGGPAKFYQRFYFSSVSPLGFVKDGKNLNYYDIKNLQQSVYGFIVETLTRQLEFGVNREVCFCLGEGKNFKFLSKLNNDHGFFKRLVPLPHPRYVMQYKRKRLPEYIQHYLNHLT